MLFEGNPLAVQSARPLARPQFAQRARRGLAMFLLRERVRAEDVPVRVIHAHRLGQHIEDRRQLRHAAGQVTAQILPFGDVSGDDRHAPCGARVANWRERRFDNPRPVHAGARHADGAGNAERAHLVDRGRDVDPGVGERFARIGPRPDRVVEAGDRAIARVAHPQPRATVEHRERDGNGVVQRLIDFGAHGEALETDGGDEGSVEFVREIGGGVGHGPAVNVPRADPGYEGGGVPSMAIRYSPVCLSLAASTPCSRPVISRTPRW